MINRRVLGKALGAGVGSGAAGLAVARSDRCRTRRTFRNAQQPAIAMDVIAPEASRGPPFDADRL